MRTIQGLSDNELVANLAALAKGDREANVEIVRHLAEMDARKLHLGMGYSSMWAYCREALKFSESVSHQRIAVARASKKHPDILDMLSDGRLSLCTAADLAPRLEQEGKGLLERAAGRSRKEVQAMAGVPVTAKRDVIRRAPAAKPGLGLIESKTPTQVRPPTPVGQPPATKARVAFSASDDVVAKLEKLQQLMGDASLEEVIGKAADLLLAKVDPQCREARRESRKTAKAKRSPKAKAVAKIMPRRPSVALRDQVLVAAGRRCEYVSSSGLRCAETRHLEIDHIQPYALGGTSTDQSNLRCLCRAHNQHLGRASFGPQASAASH